MWHHQLTWVRISWPKTPPWMSARAEAAPKLLPPSLQSSQASTSLQRTIPAESSSVAMRIHSNEARTCVTCSAIKVSTSKLVTADLNICCHFRGHDWTTHPSAHTKNYPRGPTGAFNLDGNCEFTAGQHDRLQWPQGFIGVSSIPRMRTAGDSMLSCKCSSMVILSDRGSLAERSWLPSCTHVARVSALHTSKTHL